MRWFRKKKTTNLFAIGDIHGNVRALNDLLEKILPQMSSDDTLVFLGDYIDRGPNVRDCIDRIIDLKKRSPFSVVTLRGNHEDWMMESYRDPTRHFWFLGMEALDTIASYSEQAAEVLTREAERSGTNLVGGKSPRRAPRAASCASLRPWAPCRYGRSGRHRAQGAAAHGSGSTSW